MATQTVYVNGILDCTHSPSAPLEITNSTSLTIGVTYPFSPFYYNGLIDQVSLVWWTHNATEILDDATLVAYYSFDSNSFVDSGPNGINGTGFNVTFANNSLVFNTTSSYFQASGLVLLGTSGHPYSVSLWINPFQTNGGTVLHASQNNLSIGGWCTPFLGFNSQGQIYIQNYWASGTESVISPFLPTDTWTHLAETYSPTKGISLYVNGSLFSTSAPFFYATTNAPFTVTLGSSLNSACAFVAIQAGQFWGQMDEFRVYSRELTAMDVQKLATQ